MFGTTASIPIVLLLTLFGGDDNVSEPTALPTHVAQAESDDAGESARPTEEERGPEILWNQQVSLCADMEDNTFWLESCSPCASEHLTYQTVTEAFRAGFLPSPDCPMDLIHHGYGGDSIEPHQVCEVDSDCVAHERKCNCEPCGYEWLVPINQTRHAELLHEYETQDCPCYECRFCDREGAYLPAEPFCRAGKCAMRYHPEADGTGAAGDDDGDASETEAPSDSP